MREPSARDAAGITTTIRPLGVVNGRVVWPIAGGAPTMAERIQRQLDELEDDRESFTRAFRASGRDKMLASERRDWDKIQERETELRARLREEEDREHRRGLDADAHRHNGPDPTGGRFGVGADTVYARTGGNSYFADLIAISMPGVNPEAHAAMQRLQQHAQVVERASADLPAMFRSGPERRGAHQETRVNPNRTDGQGGFFLPPLWIIDEFVAALRAGRALADRCNVQPLPPGTDSINLPKVNTGTTTAVQTADNAAVSSTDLTDTSMSAGVKTIAGQNDIAMQLLEQSPVSGGFDQVVLQDLSADYNMKLDLQVLAGSAASGQARGILNVSGINGITYTDATPTLGELWVPLMQALSQVAKNRFLPVDSIGMHPSLWYWATSQLDTTGRPLIAGDGDGMNSIAVYDANAAEGVVGAIGNVPIVIDANMPTNLGAGTNETRIIAGRYKDAWLWEGALRTRVMPEVLSGVLSARIQLYNYFAFMPDRYPVAFSVISGTGCIPQAGF